MLRLGEEPAMAMGGSDEFDRLSSSLAANATPNALHDSRKASRLRSS